VRRTVTTDRERMPYPSAGRDADGTTDAPRRTRPDNDEAAPGRTRSRVVEVWARGELNPHVLSDTRT
jgi:hypothetical protein